MNIAMLHFSALQCITVEGGTVPPRYSTQAVKPDIVMIDNVASSHTHGASLTLVEVTIPWDSVEAIEAAETRKKARYADLVNEVSEKAKVELVTIEIGVRGLISAANKRKLTHLCRKWKIREISAVMSTLSRIAHQAGLGAEE